jgi:hypothetical protein
MRRLAAILALLGVVLASGCSHTKDRVYFLDSVANEERPATYLGIPLEDGQLVLTEAPGAYSFLFSLGTEIYSNFTHAGIIGMENGKPYVYEMTGEYDPFSFSDVPADGIVGECRRRPFMEYVRGNLYVEVFDPPAGVDRKQVADWVRKQFADQPAFDAYFVWEEDGNHDKLFCTEFVQLALEAGGGPPVQLRRVRQNASLQRLLEWNSVTRDWGLPAGVFADPQRSVAALGQFPTKTAAATYFAAKAEVHRRFTPDQTLGNVFRMKSMADIALRDTVVYYLRTAVALFENRRRPPSADEIHSKIVELATDIFGVAPPEASGDAG